MVFQDIVEGYPEELVEIMTFFQSLILSLDERIEEGIYGGKVVRMASYSMGRPDNVIAVTGLGKGHCKLFLHHTDKIDTKGLKLQGKGKHAKHIKINHRQSMDDDIYTEVLRQVADVVRNQI